MKSEQLTVHLKNPKVYIKWQTYLVFPLLLFLLQGLLEALCWKGQPGFFRMKTSSVSYTVIEELGM